jgi:uncharacterized protein (DUF2342 family)
MQNAVEGKQEHASLLLAVKLMMAELASRDVDPASMSARRACHGPGSKDCCGHARAASLAPESLLARRAVAVSPILKTIDEPATWAGTEEAGAEEQVEGMEAKMERLTSMVERQGVMLGMVLAKVCGQSDVDGNLLACDGGVDEPACSAVVAVGKRGGSANGEKYRLDLIDR